MSHFCATHRPPIAGVDRITGATDALAVIRLAMQRPLVAETVALVLDAEHRGRTIVVVDGTGEPDSVVDVTERLAESLAAAGGGALVVASVRPGQGVLDGDPDRWCDASEVAEHLGVELLEWFVIDDAAGAPAAWCPRDLLAEPPRWV